MRFNNIQILRFLAAAGVLLYHGHYYTGEWLAKTPLTRLFDYRYSWGVELFFAISGFVVSHSLSRTPPGRFLVLRLIRIYPAFWLAAAIVVAGRLAVGGHPFAGGLAPTLTLLPVAGAAAPWPLGGVEWSLVYEVFFYGLLAAVALVPARNAREWAMVAWLAAILAWGLWGPVRATAFHPSPAMLPLSAFNLPFIAGVLAYSWFRRVERLPVAALVCTVPAALVAADRAPSAEIMLAWQAVGFGALVLLAAAVSRVRDALPTNPLVRLGDASYGLYLVHVSVIKAVLTRGGYAPADADDAFFSAVCAALVIGSAFGFVEITLYRRNKRALDRRWPRHGGLAPPEHG